MFNVCGRHHFVGRSHFGEAYPPPSCPQQDPQIFNRRLDKLCLLTLNNVWSYFKVVVLISFSVPLTQADNQCMRPSSSFQGLVYLAYEQCVGALL